MKDDNLTAFKLTVYDLPPLIETGTCVVAGIRLNKFKYRREECTKQVNLW
jgi:hypothetical protein